MTDSLDVLVRREWLDEDTEEAAAQRWVEIADKDRLMQAPGTAITVQVQDDDYYAVSGFVVPNPVRR